MAGSDNVFTYINLWRTYIEGFEEADVSDDPHPHQEAPNTQHQSADVVILGRTLGMLGRKTILQHKSQSTTSFYWQIRNQKTFLQSLN